MPMLLLTIWLGMVTMCSQLTVLEVTIGEPRTQVEEVHSTAKGSPIRTGE